MLCQSFETAMAAVDSLQTQDRGRLAARIRLSRICLAGKSSCSPRNPEPSAVRPITNSLSIDTRSKIERALGSINLLCCVQSREAPIDVCSIIQSCDLGTWGVQVAVLIDALTMFLRFTKLGRFSISSHQLFSCTNGDEF